MTARCGLFLPWTLRAERVKERLPFFIGILWRFTGGSFQRGLRVRRCVTQNSYIKWVTVLALAFVESSPGAGDQLQAADTRKGLSALR